MSCCENRSWRNRNRIELFVLKNSIIHALVLTVMNSTCMCKHAPFLRSWLIHSLIYGIHSQLSLLRTQQVLPWFSAIFENRFSIVENNCPFFNGIFRWPLLLFSRPLGVEEVTLRFAIMSSDSEVPRLVYFSGRGRAEIARILFAAGGVQFKDERVKFAVEGGKFVVVVVFAAVFLICHSSVVAVLRCCWCIELQSLFLLLQQQLWLFIAVDVAFAVVITIDAQPLSVSAIVQELKWTNLRQCIFETSMFKYISTFVFTKKCAFCSQ